MSSAHYITTRLEESHSAACMELVYLQNVRAALAPHKAVTQGLLLLAHKITTSPTWAKVLAPAYYVHLVVDNC